MAAESTSTQKVVDSFAEIKDGAFKRSASQCRDWVKADGSTAYPPESGRYILYISYACPWASRCYAVLSMKGLLDHVKVVPCEPVWGRTKPEDDADLHMGWLFTGRRRDPLGHKTVRDVYTQSKAVFTKPTVPVLYDMKTSSVVNNESADIMRMFNSEFNALAKNPDLDLYPAELEKEMEAINEWVYRDINNGVYKAGFAQSQAPYHTAVTELYNALDRAERILEKQRFLLGDTLTAADIRLFVTLIRFDEVYVVHFKCNKATIREYPALHAYMLDVYQTPGVAETVVMDDIKKHYYMSHPKINPMGVVPEGPNENFLAPHGRDVAFTGSPAKRARQE